MFVHTVSATEIVSFRSFSRLATSWTIGRSDAGGNSEEEEEEVVAIAFVNLIVEG